MKTSRTLVIAGIAAAFVGGTANAQTVGIGSTKGSLVALMTKAISSMISGKTTLKVRTQVMGGTQKYISVVNAGGLEFGTSNIIQYTMARDGWELSKKRHKNLRLVATLMRFRTGVLVRNDSGIRRIEDLRGKRIASGFSGAPLFDVLWKSFLANGGMTYADVEKVPVVGLAQHWGLFKQGKVDAAVGGLGGRPNKGMNAKIPSGVRYLSLNTDTPAAKRSVQRLAGGIYEKIGKKKPFVAIKEPAVLLGYDFVLFTSSKVPADTVYKVAKAMYQSVKDLHATSPVWRSYNQKRMSKDHAEPYHPGAVKFYKEIGVWRVE